MRALLVVPLALLLAACSSAAPSGQPTPSPSAAAPSVSVPAPSVKPTYADVSRGDTDSTVRMLALRSKAVVVEPVVFMTNPDFCATFGIPADDGRCNQPWDTADSEAKITVPVADDATYALVDLEDPQRCMDDRGAGSCKATAKEFAAWAADDVQPLIRLTTKNGVATRLAEMYVP